MRKKVIFSLVSVLAVLLAIGGYLLYVHEKETRVKLSEEKSRAEILNYKKPLTDKVGSFVWLYAYQKGSKKNREYIQSQVQLAKKSDLKYVVLPVVFYKNYIKSGKFDFDELDMAIRIARKEHLKPILVFSSDNSDDTQEYKKNHNVVVNKYGRLIKKTIVRYKNQGVVWQMWNEPNSLFWFNQSEDGNSVALTKAWNELGRKMKHWVRQFDPRSVFLGGAIAGNYEDSKKAITLALSDGLASYSDAIANHPYLSSDKPDNGAPENLLSLNSRKLLASLENSESKKQINQIPLVTTEFGYSMQKTHQGVWSEGDQANYLARSIFVLDMLHQPIISTYCLVDEGNGDGQWGMYSGQAPRYVAKQSGQLIVQLLSNLNGFTLNTRIKQESSRDYVLEYTKKSTENRYVCWTMGSNHVIQVAGQNVELSQTPQIVYAK